jgi:hypothetical protein
VAKQSREGLRTVRYARKNLDKFAPRGRVVLSSRGTLVFRHEHIILDVAGWEGYP